MLRPQDNEARETKRLDGMWSFTPDPDGVGRREEWWKAALPGARPMPVPAAYNDVLVEAPVHDLVGDVWYQREVVVPRGWDGRRVVLRFDAATHRATVWVGDEQVAEHEGGYTPFEADISASGRAGHHAAGHRRGQQRADVGVDPAGRDQRGPGRHPARSPTSRTSSTTPA